MSLAVREGAAASFSATDTALFVCYGQQLHMSYWLARQQYRRLAWLMLMQLRLGGRARLHARALLDGVGTVVLTDAPVIPAAVDGRGSLDASCDTTASLA